jgi:Icc protein
MDSLEKSITQLSTGDNQQITLIQITDTHILDDGVQPRSFEDFDTSESLKSVVTKIGTDENNADCIILTGDLVHEPGKNAYQKVADQLSPLTIPVMSLPGNHDDPQMMKYILGENGFDTGKLLNIGSRLIILLDSRLENEHSGELTDTELEFLRTTLESNTDKHCLIALHHHPVSINSPWMDSMILKNADDFLNVIDDFNNVRGIIWGHIHQKFKSKRNDILLLGTPSTCKQFKPKVEAYAVDNKPPAYRKIELFDDGKIKTQVVYIDKQT